MPRIRVALLVCTNVIGGHEYQAAALGRSLSEYFDVTVFVNRAEHSRTFQDEGLDVKVVEGLLLGGGRLPNQIWAGWKNRRPIRILTHGFDQVIVSAGAIEAGVAAGVALIAHKQPYLYLPSFFDRVAIWGWIGYFYNFFLSLTFNLFSKIITINRIQSHILKKKSNARVLIIRNRIRVVSPAPEYVKKSRLVYIGRMDRQKRLSELISWLDFPDNPFHDFLIIGDGPLLEELKIQSEKCRYLRCEFTGWLSASIQDTLVCKTDVLVINSLIEGEPLIIREAIMRGMRIIARDITGVRGITRPYQRFNNIYELRNRLYSLASGEDHPQSLEVNISTEYARKRSEDVKKLVADMQDSKP